MKKLLQVKEYVPLTLEQNQPGKARRENGGANMISRLSKTSRADKTQKTSQSEFSKQVRKFSPNKNRINA